MMPTGRILRFATLTAALAGCGSPVAMGGGGDAATPTDVQGGADVIAMDVVGTDVVIADTPSAPDVVDVLTRVDVVAPTDGGTKTDGSAPTDAASSTDLGPADDVPLTDDGGSSDSGGRDVPPSDAAVFTCPVGISEISLPGAVAPIMGTTSGTGRLASSTCQGSAGGPEHFYTLRVTQRTGVILHTENMATAYDTILTVRRCDTGAEIACDDDGGEMPSLSSVIRTVLDPGTYTVVVDGFNMGAGAYVLSARSYAVAANSACSGALSLAPGATLAMQDLNAAGTPSSACSRGGDSGPLYYSLTVPPGSNVTASATPVMGESWTPTIRALESCTATTCAALGTAGSVTVSNTTTAPRTVQLAVSRANSALGGSFSLTASAAVPLAANATCAAAATLTPGAALTGQDLSRAALPGTACLTSFNGGQLFYTVTVAPNSASTVVARPTGTTPMWTPVMRLLDACDATTCVASATGTAGNPATLPIVNLGTTPRSYKLSVAASASGLGGVFNLEFSSRTVSPPALCERPIALSPNGMAIMGDTALGILPASRCATGDMGREVFYTLDVPAATRVALRVVPSSGATWRPRIRTLASCAATTCLANVGATTDGGEATLNVDNNGLLPMSVVVSVGSINNASGGAFALTGTSSALAQPFTLTTLPAACDDVTMGTTVAPTSGWTDDSVAAIAALPFTVRFFGTDTTHYTVSSNGLAQLWTLSTGTGSTSYTNVAIPNEATPNNFVAPYWDDLVPVAMTSLVRAHALGAAPSRRFVIEWRDWRHIDGMATDRLTFQAKLFETTGVFEFHYCSMLPANAMNSGESTTIGVEAATGTTGGLISLNTASRAATGTAYRLTPR